MPLTGILKGDFSSFIDAVSKAEAALKDFDAGAGKVQTGLNKMADAFSGKKIIQDAEFATKAVKDIGGATTLTANEQAKLNAILTEAIAKYTALGQKAPADMVALAEATKKVDTAMTDAAKPTSAFADYFKGAVAGMLTATAVIATVKTAIRGLSEFIGSSVEAYAQQETAIKKMTVALQQQGTATPQAIQQFKDLASQFQNTTAFGDDLINEMEALLTQVGNVLPREMEGALKAATDLSVGLGVDLRDATMVVAKAFEGNTAALKKMGIEAKDGATAIAAINEKFGGQAAAEIETYAGRVKQLANAWGEVKEAIGKSIVTDPLLVAFMNKLGEAAKGSSEKIDGALPSFTQLAVWLNTTDPVTHRAVALAEGIAKLYQAMGARPPSAPDIITPELAKEMEHFGRNLIDVNGYLTEWEEKNRKAKAAAEAHATALKSLRDELFGTNIKDAASLLTEATGSLTNLSKMSRVEQDKINKSISEALDVYKRFGQVAPQAMRDLYIATAKMPDVIDGGSEAMKQLQRSAELAVPTLYEIPKAIDGGSEAMKQLRGMAGLAIPEIPKQVKIATASLSDMSRALSELATVSGGTFGGMVSSLASIVSAANTAQKSIDLMRHAGDKDAAGAGKGFAGILEMSSGILGVVSAAIAAGKAVAALFSIFDRNKGRDVVVDFAETFGGFDALHVKLLELGADGEALWIKLTQGVGRNNPAQAQKVIDEVTQALDEQAKKSDEAKGATEEQAQATIETASQAAKALEELGPKLADNAQQWKDWGAVVTGVLQEIANGIRALPVASPGGSLPFSAGSGGSTSFESKSLLYLDGKQIAENTAYHLLN